jgi:Cu/Ag efflux pump CusA
MAVGSWLVTRRLSSDLRLSRWQNLLEVVVLGICDQIHEVTRKDPRRFLPFVGTLFLFIAVANLLAVVPGFGQDLYPTFKERDLFADWATPPGTSGSEEKRIVIKGSKDFRAVPAVESFGAHIGQAFLAEEVVGPNFGELWISIDEHADYDATVERVEQVVHSYPGLYRDVLTYLRERIKEVLTGASATIVVRIFGPELDVLQRKAAEVGKAMAGVQGAADVKVQALTLVPQVEVAFDRDRAQQVGVTPAVVRDTVATMLRGVKVGEVFDAQKIFDVVVWGAPDVRSDLFALRRMPVELPAGNEEPRRCLAQ